MPQLPQHRRWRGFGARPAAGAVAAVAVLSLGSGAAAAPTSLPPAADSQLSITVTPNPGYVGGTVAVDFVVHYDGSNGSVQFVVYPTLPSGIAASPLPPECTPVANGGCALPAVPASPATISVPFTLYPSAPGSYPIIGQLSELTTAAAVRPRYAAPLDPQPPVSAVLTVLQPSISLLPPVASPGQVVLVEGRDFPPGSVVGLGWDPGITASAVPPVADAAGTFTAQLLVMGGDRTGQRRAVAGGEGFAAADAPLLVTPDRLMPPLLGAAPRPAGAPR